MKLPGTIRMQYIIEESRVADELREEKPNPDPTFEKRNWFGFNPRKNPDPDPTYFLPI